MADSRKIQEVPSNAINPRQWLTDYFHTREHLASSESDFRCDAGCTRPGCKNQNLQIPVSLVDLVGAARYQDGSVSATYQRNYALGLLAHERYDWIRRVSLRLKKPCPFLENDLCRIYPVRPLACVLFPEYLVYEGRFEAEARKEHFRDFLCLQNPVRLSPQRAEVVGRLKKMWQRETLISSFYLFNHSQCYIDYSNLTKELLLADKTLNDTESKGRPEPRATIPNQVMEHFFQTRMAQCQPFDGVRTKISRLNNQEGQRQFLQLLQDDRLMKQLLRSGDDRALIFRFIRGKLKGKRRSLIPGEYKFS
jgi:Fe-S-cluster containining protein